MRKDKEMKENNKGQDTVKRNEDCKRVCTLTILHNINNLETESPYRTPKS